MQPAPGAGRKQPPMSRSSPHGVSRLAQGLQVAAKQLVSGLLQLPQHGRSGPAANAAGAAAASKRDAVTGSRTRSSSGGSGGGGGSSGRKDARRPAAAGPSPRAAAAQAALQQRLRSAGQQAASTGPARHKGSTLSGYIAMQEFEEKLQQTETKLQEAQGELHSIKSLLFQQLQQAQEQQPPQQQQEQEQEQQAQEQQPLQQQQQPLQQQQQQPLQQPHHPQPSSPPPPQQQLLQQQERQQREQQCRQASPLPPLPHRRISGPRPRLSSRGAGSPLPAAGTPGGAAGRAPGQTRPPAPATMLNHKLLGEIGRLGPRAVPGWDRHGSEELLAAWGDALRRLPAASERLAAVSGSGPAKVVCLDLETCSTGSPVDVTELGAATGGGQVFQLLCRPVTAINPKAALVSGLSWDLLCGAPCLPQVLLSWVEWLEAQCRAAPGGSSRLVLVGHNVKSFDLSRALRPWARELGLPQLALLLGEQGDGGAAEVPEWPVVDTLTLARDLGLNLPGGLTLASLCSEFGISNSQAHRAVGDVHATLGVFRKLAQMRLGTDEADVDVLAGRLLGEGSGAAEPKQQQQQKEQQPKQQPGEQEQQQGHLVGDAATLAPASAAGARSGAPGGGSPAAAGGSGAGSGAGAPGGGRGKGAGAGAPPPSPPPGRDAAAAASGLGAAVDAADLERRVQRALEALGDGDLRFDREEVAAAWQPFGQAVGAKCKVFTDGQRQKLAASGFDNVLQVVVYAPSIHQHSTCIRVGGDGGGLDGGGGLEGAGSPTSSTSDAEDAEGVQLVDLRGRCVGADPPRPMGSKPGAFWVAAFQVPSDAPGGGPVGLKVSLMVFSFTARQALSLANAEYQRGKQAAAAGEEAHLRGPVKRITHQYSLGGVKCGWESAGSTMTVRFASNDDGDAPGEQEGCGQAGGAGGAAPPPVLVPVYRKVKEVSAGDWVSKGARKGIIDKALEAACGGGEAQPAGDLLPEDLLAHYGLPSWAQALRDLHHPSDVDAHRAARQRIAFQELVLVQMAHLIERYCLQRGILPHAPAAGGSEASAPKRPGRPRRQPTDAAAAAAAAAGGAQPEEPLPPPAAARRPAAKGESAAEAKERLLRHRVATPAYRVGRCEVVEVAKAQLGFDLTADQDATLQEILQDMEEPRAMLRLLQGDVGCGKTVVAALACLAATGSGYQAVMLAPTELLAKQHYESLVKITEKLPLSQRPRVALLTGGGAAKQRQELNDDVAAGRVGVLVSTQAALWVPRWHRVALVVFDEQHKWGVAQREGLLQKLQAPPHVLHMTATPIPRTMALVQHGAQVLSTIRSMPPGRSPVATRVVVDSEEERREVYAQIHDELLKGGRVYIVCPLVSESSSDAMAGVRAAQEEHERLSRSGVFGGFRCGLLHGRLSSEDKARALADFTEGRTPLLISSTCVEVGIDEPEASVVLVENAERFGLASLHQLRGRVGRGSRASRCFLMAPPEGTPSAEAAARKLRVLEGCHDGLLIAEADLRMRGPGDFCGVKQSGKSSSISSLSWQELEATPQLLEHARRAAADLLVTLGGSPALKAGLVAYGLLSVADDGQLALRDGVTGA